MSVFVSFAYLFTIVVDFISKFPQYQPTANNNYNPPPPPPTNNNEEEDDDSDEEEQPPSMWGPDQACSSLSECGFVWWFARPEMNCVFIVVHCFPGVKMSLSHRTRTVLEIKCEVSFRPDILLRVAQLSCLTPLQVRHALTPKLITLTINVERTITNFENLSDVDENVKVIVVHVQPNTFTRKVKFVV